jgi:hypothetical protein
MCFSRQIWEVHRRCEFERQCFFSENHKTKGDTSTASAWSASQPRCRDFREIPVDLRKAALDSKLVQNELLDKMPLGMREAFVQCFLHPTPELAYILREYFSMREVSIISHHIVHHKASSHKALETVYNQSPEGLVDQYFFRCRAGTADRGSLNAIIVNLPDWIRQARDRRDVVEILVPGSGPTRDVIRILSLNPDLQGRMLAYCIDNDLNALELGEQLARKAGVAENIEFVHGDLTKLDFQEMDFALLVGIICPVPNSLGIRVVRKIASCCRKKVGLLWFQQPCKRCS